MIQRPKRSVTFFFVPLIDVLILLFCIFLLMPYVSAPASPDSVDAAKRFEGPQATPELPATITELQRELERARREIKKLAEGKGDLAQRLSVRVMEIDPASGRLYYFQEGERREVKDQREAQRVIDLQQRLSGTREPFFLILYPRVRAVYPLQSQVDEYSRWFQGVALGFDSPLAASAP